MVLKETWDLMVGPVLEGLRVKEDLPDPLGLDLLDLLVLKAARESQDLLDHQDLQERRGLRARSTPVLEIQVQRGLRVCPRVQDLRV